MVHGLSRALAIHAGKSRQYLSHKQLQEWPHGDIIAVADLIGCLDWAGLESTDFQTVAWMQERFQRETGLSVQEVIAHAHAEGPVCFLLANVRRVVPVPVRGAQGLWDYDGPADRNCPGGRVAGSARGGAHGRADAN